MILRDSLLHFAHFICIFTLASLLVAELAIYRQSLASYNLKRLQVVDRWYGISAGLVIASGLSLLFLGDKGSAFYIHNPVFWMKMGLFVVVALLSIVPTIAYIQWSARANPGGSVTLDDAEYRRIGFFLWAQVAVFVFIPLCATLMANGI